MDRSSALSRPGASQAPGVAVRLLDPPRESRAPYPSIAGPGWSAHVDRYRSISGWRGREHRRMKSCRPAFAEITAACSTPPTAVDCVSAQGSTFDVDEVLNLLVLYSSNAYHCLM